MNTDNAFTEDWYDEHDDYSWIPAANEALGGREVFQELFTNLKYGTGLKSKNNVVQNEEEIEGIAILLALALALSFAAFVFSIYKRATSKAVKTELTNPLQTREDGFVSASEIV